MEEEFNQVMEVLQFMDDKMDQLRCITSEIPNTMQSLQQSKAELDEEWACFSRRQNELYNEQNQINNEKNVQPHASNSTKCMLSAAVAAGPMLFWKFVDLFSEGWA